MCACAPGFVCSRCRGTRHDPAYFDPHNEVARPEEAPAESEARVGFCCDPDESASAEELDARAARLSAAEQEVEKLSALAIAWADRVNAAEARVEAAEQALAEARELLALVYDDQTDWRTNQWFVRVENVGAWPRAALAGREGAQ